MVAGAWLRDGVLALQGHRAGVLSRSRCRVFFFSSRRRHTRYWRDWSSDVCSSDLLYPFPNNPRGVYGDNTFTEQLPASARGAILSGKLDYVFQRGGRAQQMTGRYNFTNDWRDIPATGGEIGRAHV